MLKLRELVEDAMRDGWAVAAGDLNYVESRVVALGWEAVPSRRTGPVTDVLKPTTQRNAQPRSLSASYGSGDQPLHSDGAHHVQPPDVILLSVDQASDVPTLLWKFSWTQTTRDLRDFLDNGLFTVRSGNEAFLAPARNTSGLRFDPGCMEPSDERARTVVEFFAKARGSAEQHDWSKGNQVLAINNRQTLHARASAETEADRVMHRIALKLPERRKK